MREIRQMQFDGIIGVDFEDAGRGLLQPIGDLTLRAHPGARELIDLALQFRDRISLDRIERDGRGAEHRVLHEQEKNDRQQRAALERWQRNGIADEAPQRLALGGNHRDDLSRRRFLKIADRKSQ